MLGKYLIIFLCAFSLGFSADDWVDREIANYRSKSKINWVYRKNPRTGTLIIKTNRGTTLYPGELNQLRNQISFSEFLEDFFISYPAGKEHSYYTLLIYTPGKIIRAVQNLKAENLLRGEISGDSLIEPQFTQFFPEKKQYCVEILEQDLECKESYNFNSGDSNWIDPAQEWMQPFLGFVGKTCFFVIPDDQFAESSKQKRNELGFLVSTYQKAQQIFNEKRGGFINTGVGSINLQSPSASHMQDQGRQRLGRQASLQKNPNKQHFSSKPSYADVLRKPYRK